MQVDGTAVPHESPLELRFRIEQQRRVIDVQSGVLAELGFDMIDIADASAPFKEPERAGRAGRHLAYKAVSSATGGYLLLNALSTKVPGPAWWLGLAPHVRMFAHIAALMHAAG